MRYKIIVIGEILAQITQKCMRTPLHKIITYNNLLNPSIKAITTYKNTLIPSFKIVIIAPRKAERGEGRAGIKITKNTTKPTIKRIVESSKTSTMAKTSYLSQKKVSFIEELSPDKDNLVIPSASDSSTILRSQLALTVAAAAGPTPTSEP
jgi:hypothetical protein